MRIAEKMAYYILLAVLQTGIRDVEKYRNQLTDYLLVKFHYNEQSIDR